MDTLGNTPLLDTLHLGLFEHGFLEVIYDHLDFCKHLKFTQAISVQDSHVRALSIPELPVEHTWFYPKLKSLELIDAPFVTVQALREVFQARKEQFSLASDMVDPPVIALEDLRVFNAARLGAEDSV